MVFQILDRQSQELQEVHLDFRRGQVSHRVLIPGLIGSVSPLCRDRNEVHVMLLTGRHDTMITYDLKRHVPVQKLVRDKDVSAVMKDYQFQPYKMLRVTERFIKLILSDRYLIINMDNLEVTEDTEIDILIHEQSQRENIVTRGGKHHSTDNSYSISCVYDQQNKPPRTIMNLWCFTLGPKNEGPVHPE